jgi:RNA-binding protein
MTNPNQPTLQLTPSQKTELKAKAHGLNPVVVIGDKGLSPSVLKEVELALNVHGLIKVRVHGDEREIRLAHAQTLCQETGAILVQHIGKLLVLYRPTAEDKLKQTGGATPEKHVIKKQPNKRRAKRTTKRQALS